MSQAIPRKFTFSKIFDADGTVHEDVNDNRRPIPNKEVEIREAEAFDRGRKDQLVQIEQSSQAVIQNIDAQLSQILLSVNKIADQYQNEAAAIVYTIAKKIAATALDCYEIEHVYSLVKQTLSDLKGDPKVKITVTAAIADKLNEQMQSLAEDAEFTGSILIEIDEQAKSGAVSLNWSEGAVSFDPQEIEARIQQEITNWQSSIETSLQEKQAIEKGNDHVG